MDVVALCAGFVIGPDVAACLGGPPTFARLLALLPGDLDVLAPDRPLRRYRLITFAPTMMVLEAPLSIDERVLNHLLAIETIDEHLLPYIASWPETLPPISDGQRTLVDRLARLLARMPRISTIELHGADAATRSAITHAARGSMRLLPLRARRLALPTSELDLIQRLAEREVLLADVLPVIEVHPLDGLDTPNTVRAFADELAVPLLISAPEPLALTRPGLTSLEIPHVTATERYDLWSDALSGREMPIGKLAQQFQLDPGQITELANALDDKSSFDELWTSCRNASQPRLEDLARKVEPNATWDDLVLAPAALQTLHELVHQLEHRHTVHERWGMARGDARGQAITALFHGPSGTGKTHACEAIARAANLDLYHIDLSQVVDKYVGETEKRLRRIFDAAERGGAVLLFDEADALFGKRGKIERGTDRWANLEVSYLLQRMERYHGLAILTTNDKSALDAAFMRRLRFVVPFAFPDVPLRTELWRRAFPCGAPTSELDHARLATLQLTGAGIKNVAIRAAFNAAHDNASISMAHVLAAARSELAKLELPFPELEMRARN